MRTPRALTALAAPVLALGLLTGCSGEDEAARLAAGDIPASEEFNDADVTFSTEMVPHHAQALQMVDMTQGRDLSPELAELTEQIRAAQAPEIEQMVDWLEEWDQPVPETSRDHMNSGDHGDGHGGGTDAGDMPGMMTADELAEVEGARGAAFEDMWLRMMIEHHEGAVEMAETEIADGEYADTVALAESIRDGQTAEIEQMEEMLG